MTSSKNEPKTLNGLMKHLREQGVAISGSIQKRKLKNMGYYHGYKGYRFRYLGRKAGREMLDFTDFSQIAALYDMDTQLKALLYPKMMLLETALKSYTLECTLNDAGSSSFEEILEKSLTNYKKHVRGSRRYNEAWGKRAALRKQIDGLILTHHGRRPVIGHFRLSDSGIPIWALFEVMALGDLCNFYACLDMRVKSKIIRDLGMPTDRDSEGTLLSILFALRGLRNAIAHNNVVVDVHRFQDNPDDGIPSEVGGLLMRAMGVQEVDFQDITDYVMLIVYLMRCIGCTKSECKQFLSGYQAILDGHYRTRAIPQSIFSKLIRTNSRGKINAAKSFVSRS